MPESSDFALLTQLFARCRCEVSVTVNEHRNYYESVADFLTARSIDDIDADVRAEMIARDTIVQVQAYSRTPVGFFVAFHWNLTVALRNVLDAVINEAASPALNR